MKRNSGAPIAFASLVVWGLMMQAPARADSAAPIRRICESRWANNVKAQHLCQESQTAAASELMQRIESANERSTLFSVAKSCIERSKVQPPSGIDWAQALKCFDDRLAMLPTNEGN